MHILDDEKIEAAAAAFSPIPVPKRPKGSSYSTQKGASLARRNQKFKAPLTLDDPAFISVLGEAYDEAATFQEVPEEEVIKEALNVQDEFEKKRPYSRRRQVINLYFQKELSQVPLAFDESVPEDVLVSAEEFEEFSGLQVSDVDLEDLEQAMDAETRSRNRSSNRRMRGAEGGRQRGASQGRGRGRGRGGYTPNQQRRPRKTFENIEEDDDLDLSHLPPLEQFKYLVQTGFATDLEPVEEQWNKDTEARDQRVLGISSSQPAVEGEGVRGLGSPAALEAIEQRRIETQQRLGDYSDYLPAEVQAFGGVLASDMKPGEMFDLITSRQPYTKIEDRRQVRNKLEEFLEKADPSLSSKPPPQLGA